MRPASHRTLDPHTELEPSVWRGLRVKESQVCYYWEERGERGEERRGGIRSREETKDVGWRGVGGEMERREEGRGEGSWYYLLFNLQYASEFTNQSLFWSILIPDWTCAYLLYISTAHCHSKQLAAIISESIEDVLILSLGYLFLSISDLSPCVSHVVHCLALQMHQLGLEES